MTADEAQRDALVAAIEALRYRQREAWRGQAHPQGKRFTQEELRDVAPGFKNLHIRRTRRLPSRALLLQIAVYLECTPVERDELLQLAGYLPVPAVFEPEQAPALYSQGLAVLHSLPLPAALVAPGWVEVAVNAAYAARYPGCSDATTHGGPGAAIPWYFDPSLADIVHPMPDVAVRKANERQILRLFLHLHQSVAHEPGYSALVSRYQVLTRFAAALATQDLDPDGTIGVTRLRLPQTDATFVEQQLPLALGTAAFPRIIISVPRDEAAYALYRQRGIDLGMTQWERF